MLHFWIAQLADGAVAPRTAAAQDDHQEEADHGGHGDLDEVVGQRDDLLGRVLLPEVDQLVAIADAAVVAIQHELHAEDDHVVLLLALRPRPRVIHVLGRVEEAVVGAHELVGEVVDAAVDGPVGRPALVHQLVARVEERVVGLVDRGHV